MHIQAEKLSHIQHGKKFNLASDFTIAISIARRHWKKCLKYWEKDSGIEAFLYPAKLSFKYTGKWVDILNKQGYKK